jgi:hypothetical protein
LIFLDLMNTKYDYPQSCQQPLILCSFGWKTDTSAKLSTSDR